MFKSTVLVALLTVAGKCQSVLPSSHLNRPQLTTFWMKSVITLAHAANDTANGPPTGLFCGKLPMIISENITIHADGKTFDCACATCPRLVVCAERVP